jgi:hypothetical protein
MARRTSIYLTDALDEGVAAAGLPLAEILKRGLASEQQTLTAAQVREIIREEMAVLPDADTLRRIVHDAIRDAAMGG